MVHSAFVLGGRWVVWCGCALWRGLGGGVALGGDVMLCRRDGTRYRFMNFGISIVTVNMCTHNRKRDMAQLAWDILGVDPFCWIQIVPRVWIACLLDLRGTSHEPSINYGLAGFPRELGLCPNSYACSFIRIIHPGSAWKVCVAASSI